MSQPIKITDAIISEIKMLQTKFQEGVYKLGNLQVEKMELDRVTSEFISKEKRTKDEWISLQKLEQDLMDKIVKTYGEGNLNLADGTFIPTTK